MAAAKSTFKSPLSAAKKLNKKQLGILVAMLAVIGVGAFYWYKSHAYSYTPLFSRSGITASACKQYFGGYGGGYTVNVIWTKSAWTRNNGYSLLGFRPGQSTYYYNKTGNGYWNNAVASFSTNYSLPLHDIGSIYIYDSPTYTGGSYVNFGYQGFPFSSIRDC